ncbi:tumor susceptibility protein 101, partial [Brachionus plicatilis]
YLRFLVSKIKLKKNQLTKLKIDFIIGLRKCFSIFFLNLHCILIMTSYEGILDDLLSKLSYKYKDCTKRDIMDALSYFKYLSPKTDKYVYPTGTVKELVCVLGTIPVNFRSAVYNIPVQIYLNDTHPYDAPIAYVRPTAEMSVNVCETVDASGKVSLPCLTEWNHQNSDLYMLLNLMAIKFSEQTPLFSKPVRSAAIASASTGAINSHRMNTLPYPSEPRSAIPITFPDPTDSDVNFRHEANEWKKKYESCDKSLQSVMAQKNELEAETKSLRTKYESMKKISRVLLSELEVFKQKLKNYEQQKSLDETQTKESEQVESE